MKTIRKKTIIIIVSIILMVSNLPVISTTIMEKVDDSRFRYSNADASYTSVQHFDLFVGWINEWTVREFNSSTKPTDENKEIFRLYKINPLCFWRWRYYILVSRKFKYKRWDEIEPKRVPFKGISRWQKF